MTNCGGHSVSRRTCAAVGSESVGKPYSYYFGHAVTLVNEVL